MIRTPRRRVRPLGPTRTQSANRMRAVRPGAGAMQRLAPRRQAQIWPPDAAPSGSRSMPRSAGLSG